MDNPPSDMMERGARWLAMKMASRLAQVVTYSRGADAFEVRATFGSQLLKLQDNDGGSRIEWTDLDIIVSTEEMIVNYVSIVPIRGDRVTITIGNQIAVYEVLPYAGEPLFRYCDPYQLQMRIHLKLVSKEAVEPYQ